MTQKKLFCCFLFIVFDTGSCYLPLAILGLVIYPWVSWDYQAGLEFAVALFLAPINWIFLCEFACILSETQYA